MRNYNVGLVGCGHMGEIHAKQLLKKNTRAVLKGLFDIDTSKCINIAKDNDVRIYSTLDEMLCDNEIDIIVVAVPNHLHKDICIAALEHKKNVVSEKPIAITYADAVAMYDSAERNGVLLSVDQNRRYNYDFQTVKKLMANNTLKDVYRIESYADASNPIPGSWRLVKEEGGGMLLDWGVHLIDQILQIFTGKITHVYCRTLSLRHSEIDDNFDLEICFDDSIIAKISVMTNNYAPRARWRIYGKQHTLIMKGWNGCVSVIENKQSSDPDSASDDKANCTRTMRELSSEDKIVNNFDLVKEYDDSLDTVYDQFINAIEGGELSITSEQVLRVMKVIDAAFLSAEQKQLIKTSI